jgi:hypothetical protein
MCVRFDVMALGCSRAWNVLELSLLLCSVWYVHYFLLSVSTSALGPDEHLVLSQVMPAHIIFAACVLPLGHCRHWDLHYP